MKYELRNLLSVLSWIILVAGLYLSIHSCDEMETHAKPVDFLIPAIIVDSATRSNARRDSLLRPNIVILVCGWSEDADDWSVFLCNV